jgi:CheY-like chemotaxis protein
MLEANANAISPTKTKILVVDDDDVARASLHLILEHNNFEVQAAANVKEALQLIAHQPFDALLSDLHMPGAGDGLTVVSAMRHANPSAVTIIFSGNPQMKRAAAAIILQADEVLVKPMHPEALIRVIHERLNRGVRRPVPAENVATILEQCTQITISNWFLLVEQEPSLAAIQMDFQKRCAHLTQLFTDLVFRLRNPLPLGSHAHKSVAALAHGADRRRQGYTAAMIVEESRMLQVSIFQSLQDNLAKVDFSLLLVGVMTIADEVDSQLAQALAGFSPAPDQYLQLYSTAQRTFGC